MMNFLQRFIARVFGIPTEMSRDWSLIPHEHDWRLASPGITDPDDYRCHKCGHWTYKPREKRFWAEENVLCPACGHHGFCPEDYASPNLCAEHARSLQLPLSHTKE